jgi:hypothetical protein
MQFSDTSTKQGIVEEVRWETDTDTESFPIEDITRQANMAMDEYFSIAMNDDKNQSDFPVATTNIVSGQQDYSAPDDLIDFVILKAKNPAGDWMILDRIYQSESDTAFEEEFATGTPQKYQYKENSFFLYPTPNYNSTAGLKIEYKRNPAYFLTTDTTKVPGIPYSHHKFVSKFISFSLASKKSMDIAERLYRDLEKMRQDIRMYWAKRGNYQTPRLTPKVENTK